MPRRFDAYYADGRLTVRKGEADTVWERSRVNARGIAYVVLEAPSAAELSEVSAEFNLPPDSVSDGLAPHPRAKLERYGDFLFTVLKPALYIESSEKVEVGEVHAFVGPDCFVAAIHVDLASGSLSPRTLGQIVDDPGILRHGPVGALYALVKNVIEAYTPVIDGMQSDIDEIEHSLFSGSSAQSQRIYELFNEVVELQQATRPLIGILDQLQTEPPAADDPELQRMFRIARDGALQVVERSDAFRTALQNALTIQSTLIAKHQNDDARRISAWAAILITPTIVGSIYGMNFHFMPELSWPLGYPLAILLMVLLAVALFISFKSRKWL